MTTQKNKYELPSFSIVPMETICSKTGCPGGAVDELKIDMPELKEIVETHQKTENKVPFFVLDDLDERTGDNYAILFSKKLQRVVEANETGSQIIKLIDGKRGVKDIVNELCNIYDLEPQIAISHLISFLEVLNQAGFKIEYK